MSKFPKVLYHYTTFEGMNGILKNRNLWMTDTRFLNDANEVRYGVGEIADILQKLAAAMPELSGEDREKYGTLDEMGTQVPDHMDPQNPGPAFRAVYAAGCLVASMIDENLPQVPTGWKWGNGYVACFTEDSDSLGQWRGYAGGNGYALGFNREQLGELSLQTWDYRNGDVDLESDCWVEHPVPPPCPVNYGDEQRDKCLSTMEKMLKEHIGEHDQIVPYFDFCTSIFTIAMRFCMTLKERAFREEREWRLIAVQPNFVKLNFRAGGFGNGGIIPYTETRYPSKALETIVIGPGNAPELRERSIRQMLESYGFGLDRVDVVHSEVPFRG